MKTIEWYEVQVKPVGSGLDIHLKFAHHPTKQDIGNAVMDISKSHPNEEEGYMQALELISHKDKADSVGRIKLCYVDVGVVKIMRRSVEVLDNGVTK